MTQKGLPCLPSIHDLWSWGPRDLCLCCHPGPFPQGPDPPAFPGLSRDRPPAWQGSSSGLEPHSLCLGPSIASGHWAIVRRPCVESRLSQLGCGAAVLEVTVTGSHCEAVSAVTKRGGSAPDSQALISALPLGAVNFRKQCDYSKPQLCLQ